MVADDVCEELIASDNKARVYEHHLKMLLCEVLSLNQKNAQSGNISVSVIYNVYMCVCMRVSVLFCMETERLLLYSNYITHSM